jgi:hypothetical protein
MTQSDPPEQLPAVISSGPLINLTAAHLALGVR